MEIEVALEEGISLVDVIGRCDRAWSTALPPETRQKRLTSIYHPMFESFPRLRQRS